MEPFIFHHVGIAVQEIQKAVTHYRDLFGYKLTAGPFDDPIQKVSVCFLSRGGGDTVVELVAPLGPDSPVIRTLKRRSSTSPTGDPSCYAARTQPLLLTTERSRGL
jgi:catechol 2,3-dioxygenase-like lactoylglutathione lyase family enzyme